MEDFDDIAIFVRVADTGSFTAAARMFSVSPVVISRHVSRLEERMGVAC